MKRKRAIEVLTIEWRRDGWVIDNAPIAGLTGFHYDRMCETMDEVMVAVREALEEFETNYEG